MEVEKRIAIRKIQILTDRNTGHPIYYCHFEDMGHDPCLTFERTDVVLIRARKMLYKVKANPQTKNRVDIYMSIEQARELGAALIDIANTEPTEWKLSIADPKAAAKGNMQLPHIIWARSARFNRAAARTNSDSFLIKTNGYINLDLEFPHNTHIKMKEHEVHIGIQLAEPLGVYDPKSTFSVVVPESELQKRHKEKNPLNKVYGDFFLELNPSIASGLGKHLVQVKIPT